MPSAEPLIDPVPADSGPHNPGAPGPALVCRDVGKRHGHIWVLSGVSFALAPGEVVGLAGLNGAGKSTLLRSILNLSRLDRGDIRLFGREHTAPHARAGLAYLPERFSPPYYLTGGDFIRSLLRLQKTPWDPDAARAALTAMDLDAGVWHKPVKSLSKGMTQKLGLAACFLAAKPLTILDEPASGLDPRARAALKAQLIRARAEGRGVLLSSHALNDVAGLCDRMLILHQGRLRFAGTPTALLARTGADDLEGAFLAAIG